MQMIKKYYSYLFINLFVFYCFFLENLISHFNNMEAKQQHSRNSDIVTIKRINQQMIHANKGVEISIVGQFLRTFENKSSFIASDQRYFTVIYKQGVPPPQYNNIYNEIRGIPDNNGFIVYSSHTPFGNDLDMALWNKFVKLAQKYPNLF